MAKPVRGAQDDDAPFERLVVEGVEGGFALAARRFFDGDAAALVVVAFEHRGDGGLQVVDQPAHRFLESGRAPAGERDRDRLVRLREIVDVDPVGGRRALAGLALQQFADRALHARARRADGEHVEPARADARAERERLAGPALADQPVDRFEVRGRLEPELREVGAPVEPFGGQGLAHLAVSLFASSRGL
jgi:hypothetical protein